jgi:hypothetical protein
MSASLRSRPNLRTAAIRRGVPIGDLSRCSNVCEQLRLLDYIVGERNKPIWDSETECLGGFEIDNEFEP